MHLARAELERAWLALVDARDALEEAGANADAALLAALAADTKALHAAGETEAAGVLAVLSRHFGA